LADRRAAAIFRWGLAAFVEEMALLINALNVAPRGTKYFQEPFTINGLAISPAGRRLKIKIEMQCPAARASQSLQARPYKSPRRGRDARRASYG